MPAEVPAGAHGQQDRDHLQQRGSRHAQDDDRDLVGADEHDPQDHAEDTPEEDAQDAVGLVQPREESFFGGIGIGGGGMLGDDAVGGGEDGLRTFAVSDC